MRRKEISEKAEEQEPIELKIRSDLHKRPYGLLQSQGILTSGMTPREAWSAWNEFRREDNERRKKGKGAKPPKKQKKAIGAPPSIVAPVLSTPKAAEIPAPIVKAQEKIPVPKETVKKPAASEKEATSERQKFSSTVHSINEDAAKRALESYSFSDYKSGSTTASYRSDVARFDRNVNELIERYKGNDTLTEKDWERVYRIAERYSENLSNYENKYNERQARGPVSWVISGAGNYPVRAHEKKMDALRKIYEDNKEKIDPDDNVYLREIKGILSNRSIKSADENAIEKLKSKLSDLEKAQERDKAANAYFRKHGTIVGCEGVDPDSARKWQEKHDSGDYFHRQPIMPYVLQNRNAEMHRLKDRITALEKEKEAGTRVHEYDSVKGLQVVENADLMRIQLKFDEKPSADTISKLKRKGFHYSPTQGAWQRNLNGNGRYAVKTFLEEWKE